MSPVKIGVVGFGNRGYTFFNTAALKQFKNRAEITAVCEQNRIKFDFARHALGEKCFITDDLQEFLKQDLDLVLVTVPQFAHAEVAIAALKSGKNVFVDKPMARTCEECKAIIAAEKEAAGKLFMGFNLRHHPLTVKIMEQIKSGKIGFIQQMNFMDFYGGGYTYFRRWHRFHKNSGGLTVEKGCHSIDLLNMFAGARPVRVAAFGGLDRFVPQKDDKTVYCSECSKKDSCEYYMDMEEAAAGVLKATGVAEQIVNGGQKIDLCVFNSEKDTWDNTVVIIEYANGCRAILGECFTSSVPEKYDRTLVMNCWNGQLWADMQNEKLEFFANRPGVHATAGAGEDIPIKAVEGMHGGADTQMLEYMVHTIENNLPNTEMDSLDGYYAVAVAEAAEKAAENHQVVEIEAIEK